MTENRFEPENEVHALLVRLEEIRAPLEAGQVNRDAIDIAFLDTLRFLLERSESHRERLDRVVEAMALLSEGTESMALLLKAKGGQADD